MAALLGVITPGMTVQVKQDAQKAPLDWRGTRVTVTDIEDLIVGFVRVVPGASVAPAGWEARSESLPLGDLEMVR